jgi:hypothetical protein
MKIIYKFFSQLFTTPNETSQMLSKERSFFDYSSGEKIKIMRAAGRQAQVEQQQLLKTYEARFGRHAL